MHLQHMLWTTKVSFLSRQVERSVRSLSRPCYFSNKMYLPWALQSDRDWTKQPSHLYCLQTNKQCWKYVISNDNQLKKLPVMRYHAVPLVIPFGNRSTSPGQGLPRCILGCVKLYNFERCRNTSTSSGMGAGLLSVPVFKTQITTEYWTTKQA